MLPVQGPRRCLGVLEPHKAAKADHKFLARPVCTLAAGRLPTRYPHQPAQLPPGPPGPPLCSPETMTTTSHIPCGSRGLALLSLQSLLPAGSLGSQVQPLSDPGCCAVSPPRGYEPLRCRVAALPSCTAHPPQREVLRTLGPSAAEGTAGWPGDSSGQLSSHCWQHRDHYQHPEGLAP